MDDFLITLNFDIKRCENVLRTNDYLEIVITLEEIIDKYKSEIDNINIDNKRVWNYGKKDLENITDKLINKRNEILNQDIYNEESINYIIKNIKDYISIKEDLCTSEKVEILKNIESISLIKDEKIDKNLKWEKLKKYILWASYKEVKIGSSVIELINLIIKTSN
ncbi:hypothetical protein [Paraclostridium sordellii]|uniref:Uncharacterized protein n=1 Tax=Paraclostridium sordellii TaxID=1505 RepID=A0A0C7Q9Y9_PARSO|nr:hypothetical protein [Paeniclostridium sordellii]CEN77955.1 Uncharacterised protein [[Clostridium] sordellii] [Paeniclostridium sordellii]CEP97637.1 Uncharacterised protein [[Clostridium] sordellii] [Paeniclostridium sordellii]CEQ03042.1 Uncharacterised protein [[Clostridium] sordellii] [Paeniclostridium sordellii]